MSLPRQIVELMTVQRVLRNEFWRGIVLLAVACSAFALVESGLGQIVVRMEHVDIFFVI